MIRRAGRAGAVVASALCLALAGCASVRAGTQETPPPQGAPATTETTPKEEAKPEKEGHGLLATILLYVPNRVIDVFDFARFGVDVGPGIGLDGQATSALQARAITQTSVGAGFQSFRHLPIQTGVQSALGVGPVSGDAQVGGWYRSDSDIRLGAHAAIVGAHAAIDPVEIADFVLGFLFIDIRDDDI